MITRSKSRAQSLGNIDYTQEKLDSTLEKHDSTLEKVGNIEKLDSTLENRETAQTLEDDDDLWFEECLVDDLEIEIGHGQDHEDEDEDEDMDFVTSDEEISAEDQAVIDNHTSQMSSMRSSIRSLVVPFIWGKNTNGRMRRYIDSYVTALSGKWTPSFYRAMTTKPHISCEKLENTRRGCCEACGLMRCLSRRLDVSTKAWNLGRHCSARAIVAHTLLHFETFSSQKLENMPIRRVKTAEEKITETFFKVVEYAEMIIQDSDDATETVESNIDSARIRLGFERLGL